MGAGDGGKAAPGDGGGQRRKADAQTKPLYAERAGERPLSPPLKDFFFF